MRPEGSTAESLDGELAEHALQAVGQQLGLGIRPEHLSLKSNGSTTLDVQAQVVEMLGAQMDIYGKLANGQRILARTEAAPFEPGTTAAMSIAIDKALLFEPGTYGKNLRAK